MNKLKLLLATLTATALAFGGGVLAACTDNNKQEEENKPPVTTTPGDDEDDDNNKPPVTGGEEDDDDDSNKPPVSGGEEDDDEDDNKPPVAATEYDVTLHAGEGTLTGSTTLKTSGGKLASLPTPTAPAGYVFIGWYNAEQDGMEVDTDTVFEGNSDIYARYNEQYVVTISITKADGSDTEDIRLAWLAPDQYTLRQYFADEVELSAGDTFVFKKDGEAITHSNEFGLWATGSHGVDFNQSTGVFTVKAGEDRSFEIYAKLYTDCWTMYITDNVEDTFEEGAYLIGSGWEGDGSWSLTPANYIDPVNGLTVTLRSDASFKIADYNPDGTDSNIAWNYNSGSYYKVADDAEGYLNLGSISSSGNGSVLTPGEYTITIVNDEETSEFSHFLFTPAEGLEPAPVDNYTVGEYYLVGQGFTLDGVNAEFGIKKGFEIGDGITVYLNKGVMFKAVICTDAVTGGPSDGENTIWKYNDASFYQMAEGKENGYVVFESGNNVVKAAGNYTITVDNSGDTPVFIITPAEDVEPNLTQPIYHYYIKGNPVTGPNWEERTTDEYKMTNNDGVYTLTIHLAAGNEFMFWAQEEDPETHDITRSNAMIQQDKLVANDYVGPKGGSNMETKVDGTYTFTFDSSTNQLTVTCVPDSTDAGDDSVEE